MKFKFKYAVLSVLAGCFLSTAHADKEPDPARLGQEREVVPVNQITVENLEGKHLGRIKDIVIDLDNGRIVEVLVRSGGFMGVGGRIIAVPPSAFTTHPANKTYKIDVTEGAFKAAPAVDVGNWADAGRSDRVAAAYRYFGSEPYFAENGARTNDVDGHPKVALGYVERSNKILRLPVRNKQNDKLGSVSSVGFDVSSGRVLNVTIKAPGFYNERSVVPAMALRFNAVRDGLVLDDTIDEFAAEPRVERSDPGNGQPAFSREESYQGPRTTSALEQGNSHRDADRTKLIKRKIRDAKIDGGYIDIGTINGRVTLRGWVKTTEARTLAGEIAIQASRVEVVDNQITVGEPVVK
ncbi:MAG TPA: PRC-barrel domain-containing protein [Rariglobus sp.]|nr:PRC-barrel domain-containing protein [Rariglobus sp.]